MKMNKITILIMALIALNMINCENDFSNEVS